MRAFDKVESLIFQAAPDRLLRQRTCRNWHLVVRPTSILACQTPAWLPGLHWAGPSTPLDECPVRL
jgi:hypothetical protein